MTLDKKEQNLNSKAKFAFVVIIICFCVSIIRLFDIQIVRGEHYRNQGRRLVIRSTPLFPERGHILDRNMENLTYNAADGVANRRIYPHGYLAGQVIGYTGKDNEGLAGIEKRFNSHLRGTEGWQKLDRFSLSGIVEHPQDGHNVVLTIDRKIQYIVDAALREGVGRTGAVRGTAIVSNPATGEILAMSNYPFIDPNNPSQSLDNAKNLAISLVYEPGSIIKPIPALIALEYSIFSPDDLMPDTHLGRRSYFGITITDHTMPVDSKPLTFTQSMAISSNVAFCSLAEKLGRDKMWEYYHSFGIGSRTGVQLPAEERGLLKSAITNQWSNITTIMTSIGYAMQTTPIQLLSVYNTIANKGIKINPYIVKKIVDKDGNIVEDFTPMSYDHSRIGSDQSYLLLKDMLQAVVDSGTGTPAMIENIEIAGKTGTAEKFTAQGYSKTDHFVTFAGFLPTDNPVLSCIVVLDNPKFKYRFAGQSGGPIFRTIIERILANPNLEYSLKIRTKPDKETIVMPSIANTTVQQAREILQNENIRFSVSGRGTHVVNQIPQPGKTISENQTARVILGNPTTTEIGYVPSLIGMSARKAVKTALANEYVPILQGSGIVVEQFPRPGETLESGSKLRIIAKN